VEIIFQQTPNYSKGRRGHKIIGIINHITAGLMPGTLSWLCNPQARASSHYLITKKGKIYQLVKDEDTAWHAGIVNRPRWPLYNGINPNFRTIGIEHESRGEGLTEAQYLATLYIHRLMIQRYGIPIDVNHIIGHCLTDSVNRPNDPGPNFPWERLFNDLKSSGSPPSYINATVIVNGVTVKGVLTNNRTYAKVKELVNALGREVTWDGNTRTVVIPPTTIVPVYTNEIKIITGGTSIKALIINDESYAPVRELVESLGHQVDRWDNDTKTAYIK